MSNIPRASPVDEEEVVLSPLLDSNGKSIELIWDDDKIHKVSNAIDVVR